MEAKAAKLAKGPGGAEPPEDAGDTGSPATGPVASGQGPAMDYKDVRTLQRLTTPQGKIFSRKRSGTCATHQRQIKRAIKRARFIALLPYVGR